MTNHYEILEIPSDADEREIKRAYHRLARDLHPDKAENPEEARRMEERFALVSAAYNTLKDAAKRQEYDRVGGNSGASGGGQTASGDSGTGPQRVTATAAVISAGRGVPPATATPAAARPAAPAAAPTGSSGAAPVAASGAANGRQNAQMGVTPQKIAIAQKAFARGMQFYKENNFAKAIEFFEAAIQNHEPEAVYHARLAISLIHARKSATRAIDAAQRAIELDPYNLEHKFSLAFIFETIGSKTNAQKVYEEILRWDQGNPRAQAGIAGLKKKKRNLGLGGGPEAPMAGGAPNFQGKAPASSGGGFLQQILNRFKK